MKHTRTFLLSAIIVLQFNILFAQQGYKQHFSYLFPLPGSEMISPANTIIFRLNDNYTNTENHLISVETVGSVTGKIEGSLDLSADNATFIFKPSSVFSPGEDVNCTIHNREGDEPFEFSYSFTISSTSLSFQKAFLNDYYEAYFRETVNTFSGKVNNRVFDQIINDTLPDGFPDITITDWVDPSAGYYFVSPWYLIIFDNYGTPVFYRDLPKGGHDFKILQTGELSYYDNQNYRFVVMNTKFEKIDEIATGNGYLTDFHEFRKQDNGHSFLLAYDPQLVDMSEVVEGGNPEAVVIGLIVQELDAARNVVFQWRSWDHYEITDAADWIDLTADQIDYVHGNSIEIDRDNTLLISSRYMSEITKISRQTGEIIWRLNGKKNMFDFINDEFGFSLQHSIRLMPDSINFSIFDNGNGHNPQFSSAVEYEINEDLMTATLIERFRSVPDIFGSWMGNTQRLQNGNTINGWGSTSPSVTEFNEEGNVLAQYSFEETSYRAFKFDWKNDAITTDKEQLEFGQVNNGDSATAIVQITNNLAQAIEINRILNQLTEFSIQTPYPLAISPGETKEVEVKFKPVHLGEYADVITFCWDSKSEGYDQRIAAQIGVTGSNVTNIDEDLLTSGIKIYPNPASRYLIVESGEFKAKMHRLQLKNMTGQVVKIQDATNGSVNKIETGDLEVGSYILQVDTDRGSFQQLVIKN